MVGGDLKYDPPIVTDGEFVIGMKFNSREVVVVAIKDYTIRRGVDYQKPSKAHSPSRSRNPASKAHHRRPPLTLFTLAIDPLTLALATDPLTTRRNPLTLAIDRRRPHSPLTRTHHSPHCCTTDRRSSSPSCTDRRCAVLTIVITPKSEKSVCHHHSPLTALPLTTPGRLCAHSYSHSYSSSLLFAAWSHHEDSVFN
ncbi:uncharacterized protein DS421_2g53520 [Arachis hypogaea]|nr:uncharacterized protein DS421_2g53520 [Arachis hypogaea]